MVLKISEEKKHLIFNMVKDGYTYDDTAKECKVGRASVGRIMKDAKISHAYNEKEKGRVIDILTGSSKKTKGDIIVLKEQFETLKEQAEGDRRRLSDVEKVMQYWEDGRLHIRSFDDYTTTEDFNEKIGQLKDTERELKTLTDKTVRDIRIELEKKMRVTIKRLEEDNATLRTKLINQHNQLIEDIQMMQKINQWYFNRLNERCGFYTKALNYIGKIGIGKYQKHHFSEPEDIPFIKFFDDSFVLGKNLNIEQLKSKEIAYKEAKYAQTQS